MGDRRLTSLLRERTEFDIQRETTDMVRTKFVYTIVEKIENMTGWIAITGNPGDGKTTAGYMVLKEMVKRGREVFHVKHPDEYQVISRRNIFGDIIMLDDVLGTFSLELSAVAKWQPVISDLTRRTDRSKGNTNYLSVLFISRWDVLHNGRSMLGDYEDHILDNKTIIFMSDVNESVIYDRLEILDHHLKRTGITDVSQEDKEDLASAVTLYGFPHCSKMYADLRGKGHDVPIKEFFSSPMQFLNDTINGLFEDIETKHLFKMLLEGDGELDLNNIGTEEYRRQVSSTASALTGSFLTENLWTIKFSHPTIHESVAYCIGRKDVDFAIDNLSLSFLIQRAKFLGYCDPGDDALIVPPTESNIARLCQRFYSLLLNRNFAVLKHSFFEKGDFCQKLFSSLSLKVKTWRRKVFFWKREMDKLHVDDTDLKGETLLHAAARWSKVTAVYALLGLGADVNKANKHGLTPFHHVCQNHTFDDNIIDLMISEGADVNKTTKSGCNSLHFLCAHARLSTIKLVIEHGAHVEKACNLYHLWKKENRRSLQPTRIKSRIPIWTAHKYGMTPFHNLCRKNHFVDVELLDLMIKHGADVKKSDWAGWTPLHCLCLNETADGSTIELMIKHGAEVNKASVNGVTPLHFLCQTVRDGDNKLNVMFEHGADVNKVDETSMTPLHDLCMNENVHQSTVALLIDHGADANKTNEHGMNPLHLLCQTKNVNQSTMDTLIAHTVEINLKDRSEMTPLQYLCQNTGADGNALASMLIHGAAVSFGSTPLHAACCSKIPNSDNIDLLSKVVADVDRVGHDGVTSFHLLCAFSGDDRSVDFMLNHGANVNKEDNSKLTALHHLCKANGINARSLDLIMSHGPDINKADVSGWTPLHRHCAPSGDARSIDIMIGHGADVNQVSREGDTPLNLLCSLSVNDRSIEVLIKHGADVNIANGNGMTPLDHFHWKLDQSTIDMMKQLASDVDKDCEKEVSPAELLKKNRASDESPVSCGRAHEADTGPTDWDDQSPLGYLCRHENTDHNSVNLGTKSGSQDGKSIGDEITSIGTSCKDKGPDQVTVDVVTEGRDDAVNTNGRQQDSSCQNEKDDDCSVSLVTALDGPDVDNDDGGRIMTNESLFQNEKADQTPIILVTEPDADTEKMDEDDISSLNPPCQNEYANQSSVTPCESHADKTDGDGILTLNSLCQIDTAHQDSVDLVMEDEVVDAKTDEIGSTAFDTNCQTEKYDQGTVDLVTEDEAAVDKTDENTILVIDSLNDTGKTDQGTADLVTEGEAYVDTVDVEAAKPFEMAQKTDQTNILLETDPETNIDILDGDEITSSNSLLQNVEPGQSTAFMMTEL